jgi:hypothetical protein
MIENELIIPGSVALRKDINLHNCLVFCIFTTVISFLKNRGTMKKIESSLEVADLKAVAHVEDYLVLFIASEDPNIASSLCVRVNFETKQIDPVQPMRFYLESDAYQKIHDGDRRISYRQRIQDEIDPDSTEAMLKDFSQKRLANLNDNSNIDWEPSWEHPY